MCPNIVYMILLRETSGGFVGLTEHSLNMTSLTLSNITQVFNISQ